MEFKKAPGKKADQSFIQSTQGMRHTTIAVNDITVANMRIIAYGSMPLGKGLQEIPNGHFLGVYRDPDQNFVELVGPKAKTSRRRRAVSRGRWTWGTFPTCPIGIVSSTLKTCSTQESSLR
jgi:hypothetical protein